MLKLNRKNIREAENWSFNLVRPEYEDMTNFSYKNFNISKYLFFLVLFVLSIFLLRIVYINYFTEGYFLARADLNYKRVLKEEPLRGIIYDRTGVQLVRNIAINNVVMIPADLARDNIKRERLFIELSTILEKEISEIIEIYTKNRFTFKPILVESNISHDQVISIETRFFEEAGIYIKRTFNREYLFGSKYSHLLGYLGRVNQNEYDNLKENIESDSLIGRMGVEAIHDLALRGLSGEKIIYINALGKLVSEISRNKPLPGEDIYLTIDNNLQNQVYDSLKWGLDRAKSKAGVAIVMDPFNGEILAMVSLPDFDPNIFSERIDPETWRSLANNPLYPFLNRAISGTYPPGSVFKMVTADAALASNVINEDTLINAPSELRIQDIYDPSKVYVYKDWNRVSQGEITVKDALARSSNTFFYTVSGGYEDFKGVGALKLIEHTKRFMLGQKLGIDLPGEKDGFVPTPEWKQATYSIPWSTGDTYNLAIGQGYLFVTPLQVANLTSIVASEGKTNKPHILAGKTVMSEGSDFHSDNLKIIKEGMRMVVNDRHGTGRSLDNLDIDIAGKTGTAQIGINKKEHAWFTSFAPYDNPEIVVTVLVEEAGEGGEFALPVARKIIEYYFSNKIEN